jgi:S1-C subfamily serine protease
VIEGAQKIVVSLNNNTTYDGTIVGTDPATDLAVLKIEANNLPSLRFGNSDAVRIGEWVLAVGNPFDLTSTVTAGIVSAKARNINLLRGDSSREIFPIESFIQTDAAVNPGNSGGALVNTRGELIGINTAIASRTGSYAGYSFAVPSSIVSKVAADLMEFGIVQRAFIGVRIQEVTQDIAKENGLSKIEGVYVNGLTEAGAAAEAGIEEGDIILRIGTNVVKTVPELQEQISRYRPGDRVDVAVWRDKKERIVPVVLRNQNGNTELRDAAIENARSALGAQLKEVDPKLLGELGISGGAQVTSLGSGKLAEAGIQPNFIITRIDGKPVNSPDEVLKTLQAKSGGVLVEGIYPNGRKAYYGFGM